MTKAATANPSCKTGVRHTGKSSLILTAAADTFPANVPPVLPPTMLPEDIYPDRVPVTIIDTSSRVEDSVKVAEELKRADAVVLTYACDKPETLDRLSAFWLPELRRFEVEDENQQVSLEQVMSPIMQQILEKLRLASNSAHKHIQKFLAASLVWKHICQQKRYSSDDCRMLPARTLFSDWR
ncbi:mitochondrial Rho GTPase 1-like [Euphorbia lathyris]|uniref:mitochondrial Rho GTPase 1-like n=1 Tax=Euphorbia lathyris TaxID=212925 RepID=UPI003313E7F0